jgi:melibiose permease/lactose/raffinose/galactose permease
MNHNDNRTRNRLSFGLGTIGRDMLYSLVSMYLIFYLTDVLRLPDQVMLWITGVFVVARVFDALNDPIMGTIVDNTRSRWGKFKPWIAFGALTSGLFTILLFSDFGLSGKGFVALFALIYVCWGLSFTANDISFWSMMPALSIDQKERERIGAFARICANLGLFSVVVGVVPLTGALAAALGSMKLAWFVFATGIAVILWLGQTVTLFGVREPVSPYPQQPPTNLRGMLKAIFGNDQLLYTAVSMALFMIGYVTTTSFGLYFFKYAFRDEGMYSIFALILGLSQITALLVFPLVSARFDRRRMYTGATILVVAGYLIFFFAPMHMAVIGLSGVLLFVGQAFIQLLMLVFLADTVEYGQWKLGKRNESVSFSLQPFINKMGGAIASGIVGVTVVLSGINSAATPEDVTAGGLLMMKIAMLVIPLLFIVAGYIIYLFKYRIDKAMFDRIVLELAERASPEQ